MTPIRLTTVGSYQQLVDVSATRLVSRLKQTFEWLLTKSRDVRFSDKQLLHTNLFNAYKVYFA